MSRQNKAAKRKIIAEGFTKMHLNGDKGPARTAPKHGKVHTDRKVREAKRIAEAAALATQAAEQAKKSAQKTGKGGSKYAQKKAA